MTLHLAVAVAGRLRGPGADHYRVSFRRATWRHERFRKAFRDLEAELVVPGWIGCLEHAIERGTRIGPQIMISAVTVHRGAPKARTTEPQIRYAFRFLDEPVRWRQGVNRPTRTVRGLVPVRWRQLPWLCPRDLEDRQSSGADHETMGDKETHDLALADIAQKEITMGSSLDTVVLEGCIKSLEGIVQRFAFERVAEKALDVVANARRAFDRALCARIVASLKTYKSGRGASWLVEAKSDCERLHDPSLRICMQERILTIDC